MLSDGVLLGPGQDGSGGATGGAGETPGHALSIGVVGTAEIVLTLIRNHGNTHINKYNSALNINTRSSEI